MITKVNSIPSTLSEKRKSYRDMIRADLNEAMSNRITQFEIEGEYNYKYLAQYVREEACRLFRSIYYKVEPDIRKQLSLEFEKRVFTPSSYEYESRFFKVHNLKGSDRYHVYVEFDYDFLDNLATIIETDTRYKYQCKEEKLTSGGNVWLSQRKM